MPVTTKGALNRIIPITPFSVSFLGRRSCPGASKMQIYPPIGRLKVWGRAKQLSSNQTIMHRDNAKLMVEICFWTCMHHFKCIEQNNNNKLTTNSPLTSCCIVTLFMHKSNQAMKPRIREILWKYCCLDNFTQKVPYIASCWLRNTRKVTWSFHY